MLSSRIVSSLISVILVAWVCPGARSKGGDGFIDIALTGDVALNWRGTPKHWKDFPWAKNPFRAIKSTLEGADLTVANMEGVLLREDPKLAQSKYNLWAPAVSAQVFKPSGIDVVSTANNHAFDGGDRGVLENLSHLKAAGTFTFGTGATLTEARRPYIYRSGGACIAIVPATMKSNRRGRGKAFLAFYPPESQDELVTHVKAVKRLCSFVIVYIHWGRQKAHFPSRAIKDFGHALVDAGADMVVGHHPHVLQGVEFRDGGVIAYSLGNFVFSNPTEEKRRTGILWATIDPGPPTRLVRLEMIPVNIRRAGYIPVVMNPGQSRDLLQRVRSYSKPFGTRVDPVKGRFRFAR